MCSFFFFFLLSVGHLRLSQRPCRLVLIIGLLKTQELFWAHSKIILMKRADGNERDHQRRALVCLPLDILKKGCVWGIVGPPWKEGEIRLGVHKERKITAPPNEWCNIPIKCYMQIRRPAGCGWNSLGSTITVFSFSRVLHWKVPVN